MGVGIGVGVGVGVGEVVGDGDGEADGDGEGEADDVGVGELVGDGDGCGFCCPGFAKYAYAPIAVAIITIKAITAIFVVMFIFYHYLPFTSLCIYKHNDCQLAVTVKDMNLNAEVFIAFKASSVQVL